MPRNNSTPNVIEIKSNEVIVIEDSNGSTIEVVSNAIVVPGLVTATGEGGAVVRDVVTHTQIDPIIYQIQNDIIIERNARIETDTTLASEIISLQVNDVDLQQEFENVRQTMTNAIVSLQVKDVDLEQQIDEHQTSLDLIASSVNDVEATLEDFAVQLDHRVRFDAAQSLTSSEKQQARESIGAEAIGVAQILVDGITPASIGAATAAQGSKADSAIQADDLAAVAFTNDYNDLSNKPFIPPSQVNSDWNSISGPSEILNKPILSNVAISGSYNDLTDKPTIYQLSTTDPMGPSDTPQVGIENTVARADHVHPLPTSDQITSSVLTGLTPSTADSISPTDTVLQAFAKLQAQSDAIYDAGSGSGQIIPSVSMGSYVDGVLTYTGGQLRPGLNAAGVIINGLARLEFAGNTPEACVTYSNASMGFDELYQNTPVSRPYLMAFIGWNGAGTVAIGWSTVGDSVNDTITVGTDPFTVEFLADRVVLTVGGVEHVSSICPVPLTTPYTKFFTMSSAEVSFFTPGGGPSGLLPDETSARIAGDEALQHQVNGRLLPVGGSVGQVLAKKGATDFDVEWTEPSVGSGTAGTAIPRSVALLMHLDGDTSDLGERTRWENPDGCNFGPGPFGLSLTKNSNQRGIYCGPSSVFNFGTYDFTLEFWIKLASATRNFGSILGSGLTNFTYGSNFLMVVGEQISGAERRIDLGGNSLGTPLLRSASVLPLNEWRHVAITRSNTAIRMFINGVLDASTSSSQEIWFSSGGTWIGSNGWDGPNGFLDGCIAEMRIDKDICRYASNFVPPSSPYSF